MVLIKTYSENATIMILPALFRLCGPHARVTAFLIVFFLVLVPFGFEGMHHPNTFRYDTPTVHGKALRWKGYQRNDFSDKGRMPQPNYVLTKEVIDRSTTQTSCVCETRSGAFVRLAAHSWVRYCFSVHGFGWEVKQPWAGRTLGLKQEQDRRIAC